MKSLDSCCTGIDYQHIPLRVPDNLKDMGMAAHEYIRPKLIYQLAGPYVISPGISANMDHQDLKPFALEKPVDRVGISKVIVVAVAGHAEHRLEGCNLFSGPETAAEISRMPNLVHRSQEFPELLAEYAMRIRYETYLFHQSFINIFFLYIITAIASCSSIYSRANS